MCGGHAFWPFLMRSRSTLLTTESARSSWCSLHRLPMLPPCIWWQLGPPAFNIVAPWFLSLFSFLAAMLPMLSWLIFLHIAHNTNNRSSRFESVGGFKPLPCVRLQLYWIPSKPQRWQITIFNCWNVRLSTVFLFGVVSALLLTYRACKYQFWIVRGVGGLPCIGLWAFPHCL